MKLARACSVHLGLWLLAVAGAALAPAALASDQVVILSPHRKSIQDEFIPRFRDYYAAKFGTPVEVEWLDNGGTADAVRLLRTRFSKNKQTADIDILWGGGTSTFLDVSRDGLLAPMQIPAGVPKTVAGAALYDQSKTWVASAMSSFGIFTNKKVLALEGLAAPTRWEDLGAPKCKGLISLADPRHSGTALTMAMIVLQARGWDQGWASLLELAANNRAFTQSSSDPIKAVVAGDAAAAMAIDFYAQPKVAELGADNLSFTLPTQETVLDPDPVAIVKGAPHALAAARFTAYLLSLEAQKLLILPKGAKDAAGAVDGPRLETMGRMAVTPEAYAATEGRRTSPFNPFKQTGFVTLDLAKTSRLSHILGDLIGATQVDTHRELTAAWSAVIKRGMKPQELAELVKPPVTEQELLALASKWDDNVLRNQTINVWATKAKAAYEKLAAH